MRWDPSGGDLEYAAHDQQLLNRSLIDLDAGRATQQDVARDVWHPGAASPALGDGRHG